MPKMTTDEQNIEFLTPTLCMYVRNVLWILFNFKVMVEEEGYICPRGIQELDLSLSLWADFDRCIGDEAVANLFIKLHSSMFLPGQMCSSLSLPCQGQSRRLVFETLHYSAKTSCHIRPDQNSRHPFLRIYQNYRMVQLRPCWYFRQSCNASTAFSYDVN